MATISLTLPADGQTIDAADVNTPFNTIATAINGALDSNNISAGGLTPANLVTGTGTTWVWQSWTPTFVNWTIGTGGSAATTAKYIQIGKTVFYRLTSTLGTSGQSVGSGVTFTLPVTSVALETTGSASPLVGTGRLEDNGVTNSFAQVVLNSTTVAQILVSTASGTYVGSTALTAAVPYAWGAGDCIALIGYYEAA